MVDKTVENKINENKNFRCPLCKKKKEYSVNVSIEFPNPLSKKYPNLINASPYIWVHDYCHICVFKIFEKVCPEMHDELREQVMIDDEQIQDDIKHNRAKCECCEESVGYYVKDADYDDETKDELK